MLNSMRENHSHLSQESRPPTSLSATQRTQALERLAIIQPALDQEITQAAVARTHHRSLRTIQRWINQYRSQGLAGLADPPRSDKGIPRSLPQAAIRLIEDLALQTPSRSAAAIHRQVTTLAVEQGWKPPSYARVYQIVKLLDPALTTISPESSDISREEFAVPHRETGNGSHMLLLEIRFTPPRCSSALVARERLMRALDAIHHHRLLLLSAPAGSGKTTLLTAWVTYAPHRIAWLSLDTSDNDPARFWASVITALQHSSPDLAHAGSIAKAMVQAPQPPGIAAILTTLVNDLVTIPGETFLVLDDYHVIEEPAIHASLAFFIDALPDHLHLVLSSRSDPDLPLSRWRVRGQLTEICDTDVRFTLEETTHFLVQIMGISLSDADIGTLFQRTEGWIAGLQLAALSLRRQADPSALVQTISGGHRYLLDYMQHEILADLPPALHDFLLQTAILSRLSAPLCQAVTATPTIQASQQMLETAERANLFLIPLDDERRWYRFHDLFREGLLARLRATQPALIPRLHMRARPLV